MDEMEGLVRYTAAVDSCDTSVFGNEDRNSHEISDETTLQQDIRQSSTNRLIA